MKSTPVSATSRARSMVSPPDASSVARPSVIRTASAMVSVDMLSRRISRQPASSSSRSWSRSVTSTSTRRPGWAARTASYAGTTPPAASTWLSLTIAMSDRLNRWLTPPPHRTAYFWRAR